MAKETISFQKSDDRSYMIVEINAPTVGMKDDGEMLRAARADSIIPFYILEGKNNDQIWYDITKLKSVKELISEDRLSDIGITNAEALLQRVRAAVENISSKYLVNDKSFFITSDTVYFDAGGNIYFTYFPAESDGSEENFRKFGEEIGMKEEKKARTARTADKEDLKAVIEDMQHAFYTMLGIAEDNLPDCGDDEYVECTEKDFNSARDEFKEAYDKAVKLTA